MLQQPLDPLHEDRRVVAVDDAVIEGFRRITEACKAEGTVMIHQLYHVGQHGDYDLSFTANFQPTIILPVLIGKISAGFIAVGLAYWLSVPKALQLEAEDRAAGIIAEGEYLGLPVPEIYYSVPDYWHAGKEKALEDFKQFAKLLDFGLTASLAAPGSLPRLAASFGYTAPEAMAGAPPRVTADVWSMGRLMHVLLAGVLSAGPGASVVVTGTLVLGVGLPLLVVGMAMEITGFLTWIALRQRVPRGMRVPGVGSLFEEADRRRAFVLHAVAGAWLVAAAFAPALARSAGLAIALAYAVSLHGQWRCWRQAATWRRDDG